MCAFMTIRWLGISCGRGLTAAGMPVISTDRTGAARELIEPENGWLIPAGNEEALYLAMRSAASLGVNHRKAMSDCARQTGRRQDIETGVQRFAEAAEMAVQHWRSATRVPEPSA